jgi:CubicO group peptidase (beta-lactamase class C family)
MGHSTQRAPSKGAPREPRYVPSVTSSAGPLVSFARTTRPSQPRNTAGLVALAVSIVLGACGSDGAASSGTTTTVAPAETTTVAPAETTTVAPAETTTTAEKVLARSIESVSAGRPGNEPGCAVGVGDETTAATTAFGVADIDTGRPIDASTLFDLGSISKQFTGGVILDLVEEGAVTLDDTVRSWLPEVGGPAGDVALRHLLHHRSGIPDYVYRLLENGVGFNVAATQADAIGSVAAAPLEFEPGSRFEYSNSNYVLLAEVAQRAAEQPFTELVRFGLLQPAGMETAIVSDYHSSSPVVATSYSHDGPEFLAQHWRWTPVGDGAIHASITDMLAWGRYLLNHVAPFIDDAEPADGGNVYGAGVWMKEIGGRDYVWHNGGWQGFVSHFAVIPDEGLTVAALCNRADVNFEGIAGSALAAWRSSG